MRLEVAGYSVQESTALYGYLTGMANGLIQVPTLFNRVLSDQSGSGRFSSFYGRQLK